MPETGSPTALLLRLGGQDAAVLGVLTRRVAGRTSVVETTSTTVSNTVTNEQIAKLPLGGRNILDFALLVPGATALPRKQ
jgi:hypothetical protein